MMWPAPGDAKGLNGIVGADHELVDPGILTKLNGDGVGVLERRERAATAESVLTVMLMSLRG
jgi:hypothetical protein